MGFWQRIGRSGKAAVLVVAGFAGGAAAIAVASVPDSNGVIHACYSVATTTGGTTIPAPTSGNVRIIDPGAGQACATTGLPSGGGTERELSWNQQGPPGQMGPTGPAGASGQNGAPGQQGPQGPAVTVGAGHTFTISGGQVITVGDAGGTTVVSPPLNPTHSVGQVTLGSGRTALRFDIAGLNFATGQHGGGGGAGKVSVHDISVSKRLDKASTKLFQYCANGKHFPKVTVTMRKAGKVYLTYTLENVVISSYQTGGSANDEQPTESLSLNFTKIKYTYSQQ